MLIYLLGVFISAVLWIFLTRARMKGLAIKMPDQMGYLLDPITDQYLRFNGYNGLLIGTVITSVLWPFSFPFLILMFVLPWVGHGVYLIFSKGFGNQKVARFIFGEKGKKDV